MSKPIKVRAHERIRQVVPIAECPYCGKQYETIPGIGGHLLMKHSGKRIPDSSQWELTVPERTVRA